MTSGVMTTADQVLDQANRGLWWQYLVVAVFGAATGFSELVTRYRDNPRRLFALTSTWLYVAGNAAVSLASLGVTVLFRWRFGNGTAGAVQVLRLMVAGFGGMFVLRSAFVTVKHEGKDISIGPGGIVGALLGAVDRAIDRHQATQRTAEVQVIMKDVSFDRAKDVLVPYTFRLMESVSRDDTVRVSEDAVRLAGEDGSDQAKAYALGVILIQLAGATVLDSAVKTLKAEISADGIVSAQPPGDRPPLARLLKSLDRFRLASEPNGEDSDD